MKRLLDYNRYINEGVRDKMTPKPKEELMFSFYKAIHTSYFVPLKDYETTSNLFSVIDEIVDLLGGEKEEYYLLSWDLTDYWSLITMFEWIVKDEKSIEIKVGENTSVRGTWTCYPSVKIASLLNNNHTIGWIFNKKFVEKIIEEKTFTNEGVRDMMTPKSMENVKIALYQMSVWDRLKFIDKNKIIDFYSKDELKKMIDESGFYGIWEFIANDFSKFKFLYTDQEIVDKLGKEYKELFYKLKDNNISYKKIEFNSTSATMKIYLTDTIKINYTTTYNHGEDYLSVWKKQDNNSGRYYKLFGWNPEKMDKCISYIKDNKLNESIRDKMTPRPKENLNAAVLHKINKSKELGYFNPLDWGLTLLDYDGSGGLNDHHVVKFISQDGRRWEMTIDERSRYPIMVREMKRGIMYNVTFNYKGVEDYLIKRGLHKIIKEGVKDMMTPISKDNREKALSTLKTKHDKVIFLMSLLLTSGEEFRTKDDKYMTVFDVVNDMSEEDIDDVIRKQYIKEGVKDMMTPKSDEDIERFFSGREPNERLVKGSIEGILSLVKKAVEDGADVNFNNNNLGPIPWTPLFYASLNNNEEVVKYLLEHGAVVDPATLKYTYERGHYKIVGLLKKYQQTNESIRDKMTPKSTDDININLKDMSFYRKNKMMLKFIREDDLEMILVMTNNGMKITKEMVDCARNYPRLSALSLLKYLRKKQTGKK